MSTRRILAHGHADDGAAFDGSAGCTVWADAADGRRVGRSQLRLAGLWCAACAGVVERALLQVSGVREARVSYATQRASVAWDPRATSFARVLVAVREAGYGAEADAAAPARAMRQAEERDALWRLFVAVFCTMQVMMYTTPLYLADAVTLGTDLRALLLWAAWLLGIPVVVFSAAPIFRAAAADLRHRRVGMDLPVALGIAITFVASSVATFDPAGPFGRDAYFDSLTMFVSFLLGGRYLALKMRNRVAATLENAATRLADGVRRVEADGSTTLIATRHLCGGDRVRVLAGEAFPADGPIVDGSTEVDEALLTGESRPVPKRVGDHAIAGSINLLGAVDQRAERVGDDTRYQAIVRLMQAALTDRPALLRTADRVAGPFLWGVLALAAGAAAAWSVVDPSRAVWVAVSVLIVTCPCALALAAPSALLAAAGALARRGVLVQRLDALEGLAGIDTLCFDKTGTLTERRPRLERIVLRDAARRAGLDAPAVLAIAARVAALSSHPLSLAIVDAAAAAAGASTRCAAPSAWLRSCEWPGLGIEAWGADGRRYRLGAAAWASEHADADTADGDDTGSVLAGPDGPLAGFAFAETLRPDACATVAALRRAGLVVTLLSGDATVRARAVAGRLGIDRVQGDATPADKLHAVAVLQRSGHRVGMVGDGLNDAPVMARADVSIAIGDGMAATRCSADVVLMSSSLAEIAWARGVARRAVRIVRQNLAWALAYNATCVPLALFGWFPPWAAGFGMAASALVVIGNSLRAGRA